MMRGRKPVEVLLTNEEKNGLNKLIRRHNVRQQIAKRARVVLAAGEGKSNSRIVREDGNIQGYVPIMAAKMDRPATDSVGRLEH